MKTYKRIAKLEEAVKFVNDRLNKEIIVADIGTDHGYLAESLSKQSWVKNVIASDISANSLGKLEKLIKQKDLKKIETMVGDGLEPVEFADVSVIAGVGGWEIIKILNSQNKTSGGELKCDYFVLQPAQNVLELRTWLFENKIKILYDYVIEDADRFYPIIVVQISKKQFNRKSVFNLWLGRDSKMFYDDFVMFLKNQKEFLLFLEGVSKSRAKKDKILYQKYKLNKLIDKLLKV